MQTLVFHRKRHSMLLFLKRALPFFAFVACIPLIIGLIGAWQESLGFFLLVVGIPISFLILIIGAFVWSARGLKSTQEQPKIRDKIVTACSAPLLFVGVVLLALPLLRTGTYIGTMSRLMVNYGQYQAIIAKVRKNPKPSWYKEDGGITYSVDPGPPIRVAFNPAGMLDNWSGIIYDPTGDVMQADGFDPVTGKFAAPDRVTKLFNGDLVGCHHLWGSYYRCSFT